MRFGAVSIDNAAGKILGHNVSGPDGRRRLRKGRMLTTADISKLRALGRTTVYVAELEPDDVDEDAAAGRIAAAAAGANIRLSTARTGRCNLHATTLGLVRVDFTRLDQVNSRDGVTLATLPTGTAVQPERMVGTLKILPYAVPERVVRSAESMARGVLRVDPLPPRTVALILSGSPAAEAKIVASFSRALSRRLEALGSSLTQVDFINLDDEAGEVALSHKLKERVAAGCDLIILAGETAIQDRYDIAPRAVERAGGMVECFGAPVDPGNLLLLAYHGDIPILGAPGCARSPKENIVDMVLPPLLAGDRLTHLDIIRLGHGGLREDVPERPLPRSRVDRA